MSVVTTGSRGIFMLKEMALKVEKMTIGKLSANTGVNIETIRYYERIGILPAPPRTEGGYRIYNPDHLKRLSFVRRSRELGFTLKQTRNLLGLVDIGMYTCADVEKIALEHLQEIRIKIAELKKLEKSLKKIVSHCVDGTVKQCPIIDILFQRT